MDDDCASGGSHQEEHGEPENEGSKNTDMEFSQAFSELPTEKPLMLATPSSGLSMSRHSREDVNNTQNSVAEDAIEVYSVTIDKSDKFKYGLAYRVFERHNKDDEVAVIIMGVLPNSPAWDWNVICPADVTLCAGDTITEANEQTEAKSIVDELLSSNKIDLTVQKTGPRWHILGDGAKPKEIEVSGATVHIDVNMQSAKSSASHRQGSGILDDEEEAPEPVQLHLLGWFYLFLAVFVPNFVLLALFSDVGYGLTVFSLFAASSSNFNGNCLVMLSSMGAVGLIVFDFTKWKSQAWKNFCILAVIYGICTGAILKARFYPVAPLVIIFFHIPVFLGLLKGHALKNVKRKSFYVGVVSGSFLCAMIVVSLWLIWMNVEAWDGSNQWGDETKENLVMNSKSMYDKWEIKINAKTRSLNYFWDCSPDEKQDYDIESINTFRYMDANFTRSTHLITVKENEARAGACARVKTIWFLAWTTPMMCLGCDGIICVFCLFNGVLINVADTSKLEKVLKQFILMISFLVFTMYVSSSVAGASMRLTGVIMAFCASGLVALCVWLYMEIGRQAITSQVRNSKLMQSLIILATSDWVRACVLIGCNALIPTILCINMLNQWVRKKRGIVAKEEPKYTAACQRIIMAIQNWNWASILVKANWLVILYWTFSVGVAKLTYVFLSWLNSELMKVPFVWVIVIFFIIGFTMFMLPPVPGIPVYITSGIILAARARDIDEVGNFWGGMCIAIIESLVLKICAVCGQYSIGYMMGKSVKVQQLIAVDKVFTRAIEKILDTRGLNLPKVSVLVGGPDWPTSVLCGILKLNLFQCCLGTLPVIFVSAPCVIAGAFLSNPGKKSQASDAARRMADAATETFTTTFILEKEDETWSTLSTAALACSFMLQLAGMVLALYYIQEVVHRDGEELGQLRPEHEAVAALTRREADYVNEYTNVLAWGTLLQSRKRLIVASTCSMLMSTFMFVMMDEACFRSFQVSSEIGAKYDKGGLNGNVMNLVMPLGWFATACFFFASSLHIAFIRWAGTEAAKRLAETLDARPPVDDDDDGDRL